MTTVLWFRRDLRLADHPALVAAAASGEPVVALFVADPHLRSPSGASRPAFLSRCLHALDTSIGGNLVVRDGDPADVVAAVADEAGAAAVYASSDFGPCGRQRDEAVEQALAAAGRRLVRVGSPYAVDPGTVLKGDGGPFQVFTPFYRAWQARSRSRPVPSPGGIRWAEGVASDGIPPEPEIAATLPAAGEAAALARLEDFLAGAAPTYDTRRDEPASDATTRLSPYLKYGCIHPRQILDRLDRSKAHEKLRSEVAWREFYADVLWHRPDSARRSLQPAMADMRLDTGPTADEHFDAWAAGRTG